MFGRLPRSGTSLAMRAGLMLAHFGTATGHPTAVFARRYDAAIFRFVFPSAWMIVVLIMAEVYRIILQQAKCVLAQY